MDSTTDKTGKCVPDAHGNCSRWCDHPRVAVPTHDAKGNPLTRDGHRIKAGLSPFPRHKGQWLVYIEPDHTDMAYPWEPLCDWNDGSEWTTGYPCPLRLGHTSSHAGGHTGIGVRTSSVFSYPTCYSEER